MSPIVLNNGIKMINYEARPTEYRGVTFKSKSEAICARGFDLAEALWEYEPFCFVDLFEDNYIPDFLVTRYDFGIDSHGLAHCVFEYKPTLPNKTYRKELYKRFEYINNRIKLNYPLLHFFLLYGSPFDNEKQKGCVVLHEDGDYSEYNMYEDEFQHNWMFNFWDEAKKYRFDL